MPKKSKTPPQDPKWDVSTATAKLDRFMQWGRGGHVDFIRTYGHHLSTEAIRVIHEDAKRFLQDPATDPRVLPKDHK